MEFHIQANPEVEAFNKFHEEEMRRLIAVPADFAPEPYSAAQENIRLQRERMQQMREQLQAHQEAALRIIERHLNSVIKINASDGELTREVKELIEKNRYEEPSKNNNRFEEIE
jgi:hypothetical protein